MVLLGCVRIPIWLAASALTDEGEPDSEGEPDPGLQKRPQDLDLPPWLKGRYGTAVGRSDGAFNGRPINDPKHLRILELRYGTIRAQALSPRESLALIEQLLGET